jgi:hypothetical protein
MSTRRDRNRRTIRLEMLEMRNAPSSLVIHSSGGDHGADPHRGHHRGPEVQVDSMHNQRGRDQNNNPGDRNRDQNDAQDNDLNDDRNNPAQDQNDAQDNDLNDDRGARSGRGGRH